MAKAQANHAGPWALTLAPFSQCCWQGFRRHFCDLELRPQGSRQQGRLETFRNRAREGSAAGRASEEWGRAVRVLLRPRRLSLRQAVSQAHGYGPRLAPGGANHPFPQSLGRAFGKGSEKVAIENNLGLGSVWQKIRDPGRREVPPRLWRVRRARAIPRWTSYPPPISLLVVDVTVGTPVAPSPKRSVCPSG